MLVISSVKCRKQLALNVPNQHMNESNYTRYDYEKGLTNVTISTWLTPYGVFTLSLTGTGTGTGTGTETGKSQC